MNDEQLMDFAILQKPLSECARDQVVCVIATSFELFIGHNRTPFGSRSCLDGGCARGALSYATHPSGGDYSNCIGVHAEDAAVQKAVRASIYPKIDIHDFLRDATAVVTREPCDGCWLILDGVGVGRVVYLASDGTTLAREL